MSNSYLPDYDPQRLPADVMSRPLEAMSSLAPQIGHGTAAFLPPVRMMPPEEAELPTGGKWLPPVRPRGLTGRSDVVGRDPASEDAVGPLIPFSGLCAAPQDGWQADARGGQFPLDLLSSGSDGSVSSFNGDSVVTPQFGRASEGTAGPTWPIFLRLVDVLHSEGSLDSDRAHALLAALETEVATIARSSAEAALYLRRPNVTIRGLAFYPVTGADGPSLRIHQVEYAAFDYDSNAMIVCRISLYEGQVVQWLELPGQGGPLTDDEVARARRIAASVGLNDPNFVILLSRESSRRGRRLAEIWNGTKSVALVDIGAGTIVRA